LVTKFIKPSLLLIGVCVLSAAPVFADSTSTQVTQITFLGLGLGDIGASDKFTGGPFTITASGFKKGPSLASPEDMFVKNNGPSELGLGLVGGDDHEISGDFFIQLNLRSILEASPSSLSLSLNSVQGADAYDVWGSTRACGTNCALGLGTLLGSHETETTFPITSRSDPFISITAADFSPTGGVLLEDVTATTSIHTPEPSSASLLLIGLVALVGAGTIMRKRHT
jgi:hypothetical protein